MVGLWVTMWLHGKICSSRAKVSWMQLYENEAACGISQVYGNRIMCPVSPEGVRE
jgi:hypothetical protein